MPAAPAVRRSRTWPQRAVLLAGAMVVIAALLGASAMGYLGVRIGQIERVDDVTLKAASAGEPKNILIVGTDSREGIEDADPDAGGFLGDDGCDCTDTILLLRIDPEAGAAFMLSFPRDLYVEMADTGTKARINTAHARGAQVLIDTIEQNFDIPVNHYAEIDFVGFQRLVDAVGGIPLWIDAPLRDPNTGLQLDGPACHVLDGADARRFVRSRHLQFQDDRGRWMTDGTADLGRITRQQIFIRRAVSKAVSRGLTNPVTLNELVSAGVANVRLDRGLAASDLLGIGRAFADFDSDDLIGFSIPSEPYETSAGALVELPLVRPAEPYLNIFRGLPLGALSPQVIDVEVRNGTQQPGQAADAAGALQAIGFNVTDVGDHPEQMGRTTVLYGQHGEAAARRLGLHVTGGAALVHDPEVAPGEVVLLTGADFTTIHSQPAPAGSTDELRTTTSTSTTVAPGGDSEVTTTTVAAPTTTTTEPIGYATGEPPDGVDCG
jgi:polyisoprenyl-teichoic acid--peptidoglycan teichoic acid transferase